MNRFVSKLRALWLVLKRHGMIKDLRRYIVWLAYNRMFEWESDQLREERAERAHFFNTLCARQLNRSIRLTVERCDPIPFPRGEPFPLSLQCVGLAVQAHILRKMWVWVERMRVNTDEEVTSDDT